MTFCCFLFCAKIIESNPQYVFADFLREAVSELEGARDFAVFQSMGLMHNYVIQCMRVRLGGMAKQVPPFFRECVFHFYILATNIPL